MFLIKLILFVFVCLVVIIFIKKEFCFFLNRMFVMLFKFFDFSVLFINVKLVLGYCFVVFLIFFFNKKLILYVKL